jgi:hypothetical protein
LFPSYDAILAVFIAALVRGIITADLLPVLYVGIEFCTFIMRLLLWVTGASCPAAFC